MKEIFIIAECGINHNGSMEYAKRSIEIAKEIGCNYWKTQAYHPESLFPNHKVIVQDRNWYPEVEKTELSFEQVSMLKRHCDKVGIEFMASAFDTKRLQWLEMLHVKTHKIATKMNSNKDYVYSVLETGKDTFISMQKQPYFYTSFFNAILLYCVPSYPTKLSDLDILSTVFDKGHGWATGFSDHTVGIEASVYAMARGAQIIEKHFKLSESDVGPDMVVSIVPSELRCLVNFARKFEEINK